MIKTRDDHFIASHPALRQGPTDVIGDSGRTLGKEDTLGHTADEVSNCFPGSPLDLFAVARGRESTSRIADSMAV